MKKYIIKRTGRRCTRYPLVLEDGRKVVLNATGTHIWNLSAGDAARIRALPDTRVQAIEKKASAPKPVAVAKKMQAIDKPAPQAPEKKAAPKKVQGKK